MTFQAQATLDNHPTLLSGLYRLKTASEKNFFQKNWQPLNAVVSAKLDWPPTATNPGQFNTRQFLWQQQQIPYSLQVDTIQTVTAAKSAKPLLWLRTIRQRLYQYCSAYPEPLRTYIAGLVIGRFDGQQDLTQDLSTLGIIHLFGLSGLHVFVLIDLLLVAGTRLKITKEKLEWFLCGFLPVYGLLVGAGTGIKRAVGVCFLGILLNKSRIYLPSLDKISLILLSQLLVNPYTLFSLGGVLSYTLSYALIFNQKKGLFAQQLILNLNSLPIILYFQYTWHFLSLLLNLIMIPFFEVLIMPLTFVACLLPAKSLPVWLFNGMLGQLDQVLHLLANFPGMQLTFGQPAIWVVLALTGLSFAIMNQVKWPKKSISLYVLLLAANFLVIHVPVSGQVALIDVGQGDSILVTTPLKREVVLIDTGGKLALPQKPWQQRKAQSIAEKVTVPYLRMQGISRIDTLFITHQDADHLGDLKPILQHFKVKRIVYAAGLAQNPHFYQKVQPFADKLQLQSVLAGATVASGPLQFKVVHPFKPGPGANEDSLVLQSKVGPASWLFMGDCFQDGELEAMAHFNLRSDYIKLGHHGSKTSSNTDFLRAVAPKLALISSGRHNRYGHPSPETLQTLRMLQVPFLNTQTDGMLIWRFGPGKHSQWTTFGL